MQRDREERKTSLYKIGETIKEEISRHDIFLSRYSQSKEESKSCVSMIYIFIVGAIIFERRVGSEFGLERIFVFYRSIISVRYSRGMDGLRHACAYRDETESLEARTNIEKHGGSTKGAGISKRGSEHQLRIPDDRIIWGIRRPILAVEKLSPSCCTGGPELIEPDINPPRERSSASDTCLIFIKNRGNKKIFQENSASSQFKLKLIFSFDFELGGENYFLTWVIEEN